MSSIRATILRTGMVTPVGLGSAQTCAAVCAGVPGFAETSIRDQHVEPFVMAVLPDEELPGLDESLRTADLNLLARQERMMRLSGFALEEALEGIQDAGRVPLYLAGPEPLPNRRDPLGDDFLSYLTRQSGVAFDVGASRTFPSGRAGGLSALQAATQQLEAGVVERVLVGGVDTYLDLYLLGTLDQADRIQSARVMDGLVPGEAAAFVLLARPDAPAAEPLAAVLEVSLGQEPGHLGSDAPLLGDGLASAISDALAGSLNGRPVQTVFAGLSGENLGAREWGVAYLRNRDYFDEDHRLEHPADCVGDTGAASGPLMLALAALGLRDGSVEGPCLVWSASDGPLRAAAVLRALG